MAGYLDECRCPICKKVFIIPICNVYKLQVKGKFEHYCSYTCYRVEQKRQERGKKARRKMGGY